MESPEQPSKAREHIRYMPQPYTTAQTIQNRITEELQIMDILYCIALILCIVFLCGSSFLVGYSVGFEKRSQIIQTTIDKTRTLFIPKQNCKE